MITLPKGITGATLRPRMIDFGGYLRPSLGGPVLRLNRSGNRFAIEVTLPPLDPDEGEQVISRLLRAKFEGLRIDWHLAGARCQKMIGQTRVNGADQSGTTLNITNGNPGFIIREGMWFSLETRGGRYLYNVAGNVTIDASGNCALPITPMLRVFPDDGDVVNFQPVIEGNVVGDELDWQISLTQDRSIVFEIEEAA